MQKRMDFPARDLVGAPAHHSCGGWIDERGHALEVDAQYAIGRGIEDQLILTDQARQLMRLPRDGLGLPEQLDEDVDLGAKDLRLVRLEDVVDGAELVAAEDVRLVAAQRGEEDDRRVARLVALANEGWPSRSRRDRASARRAGSPRIRVPAVPEALHDPTPRARGSDRCRGSTPAREGCSAGRRPAGCSPSHRRWAS